MRYFLLPAIAAGLLAACGDGAQDGPEQQTQAKPELGDWGVDLTARNPDVDPGDDFFRYANGSWLDSYELKPDQVSYGAFRALADRAEERVKALIEDLAAADAEPGSLEQMVGDYYASFMDLEARNAKGIAPIQPMLTEVAGIETKADLIRAFGRAGQLGATAPIGGGVSFDRKDPDSHLLSIGQSGLGLPDRSFYLEDNPQFDAIRQAYQAHIATMLGFAGVEDAEARSAAILALETKLAEQHWPRTELRNRDKTYNIYSPDELTEAFDGYDFQAHFEAFGLDTLPQKINVSTPSSIEGMIPLLDEIAIADWRDYLTYHIVSNHAGFLSEDIDAANFNFFGRVLRGQQEQRDLWKRGVAVVASRGALGEGLGQIYVKRHFPPEAKAEMDRLVENLRAAYRQRIAGLTWMSEETKQEAFKKLESFRPKIGYPDKWESYDGLTIVPGDLMANVMAIREFRLEENLEDLNKPTDKDDWFMTPQTVNAYYNSVFNEIVFPAAILEPPFFDPNADPAVNYGAIGGVIGHEMGHGFDDQGSKSDYAGIQRNWWTDEDRANFEARTEILVEQYNQYSPIEGQTVNGRLTLGENIGDLGGLEVAYHAYRLSLGGEEPPVIDGMTGDQRFFMAWAQVWKGKMRDQAMLQRLRSDSHSPAEFRVNGVVRNVDAWYEAFDVTEEDALYLPPEERVSIW